MNTTPTLFRTALALGIGVTLGIGAPALVSAQDGGSPGWSDAGQRGEGHAHARRGHGPRHGHAHRGHHGRWMSQLDLSDDQRTQLRAIMQEARTETQALRGSADREAMRAHRGQVRDRMRAILTAEQQAQAAALRANRGERRRGARGDRMAHMAERLDLSEAQQSQMQQIRESARNDIRQIRELETDPEARRAAVRQVWQQSREQSRAVLTAEQQATMEAHRAERGERRGERGPRGPRRGR